MEATSSLVFSLVSDLLLQSQKQDQRDWLRLHNLEMARTLQLYAVLICIQITILVALAVGK